RRSMTFNSDAAAGRSGGPSGQTAGGSSGQSSGGASGQNSGSPSGQNSSGHSDHKVAMCHKGHTIRIDSHAVPAHRKQGDTMGACGTHDHDGGNGDNQDGGSDND